MWGKVATCGTEGRNAYSLYAGPRPGTLATQQVATLRRTRIRRPPGATRSRARPRDTLTPLFALLSFFATLLLPSLLALLSAFLILLATLLALPTLLTLLPALLTLLAALLTRHTALLVLLTALLTLLTLLTVLLVSLILHSHDEISIWCRDRACRRT